MKLYRALIRSKLDYGSIVYGSARPSYLASLDPVHHQGIRIASGAFRTSPVASLYVETGEPPLCLRRQMLTLQFATKLKSDIKNPAHETAFNNPLEHFFTRRPLAIKPFSLRVREAAEEAGVDLGQVSGWPQYLFSPWLVPPPKVILNLSNHPKTTIDPSVLKNKFLELFESYKNYNPVFTDGSRANGKTGIGVAASNFQSSARLCDSASVYTAEACAILRALGYIEKSPKTKHIIISDSLSCLMAIKNTDWASINIRLILNNLTKLERQGKEIIFLWVPGHIGVSGNEKADSLAKQALQLPRPTTNLVPYTDIKPKIKESLKTQWQSLWNNNTNNKLHEIQGEVGHGTLYRGLCRRDAVVLCRARIGHTHLTHSYLLKGEPAPVCFHCQVTHTVKHIFTSCRAAAPLRQQYFNNSAFADIFKNFTPTTIVQFLKDFGVYALF